jgi:hypothetical protein
MSKATVVVSLNIIGHSNARTIDEKQPLGECFIASSSGKATRGSLFKDAQASPCSSQAHIYNSRIERYA